MASNRVTLTHELSFPTLIRSVATHKEYEKLQPKPKLPVVSPSELLGIEIEVENIKNFVHFDYYWKEKKDGSLRNNGIEYASIPLQAYQVEYALDMFNSGIGNNNNPEFSPRTSTHIHLNVRNMTWEEVTVLVLLYAIFERHFFMQTTRARERSIFCVPLYKTNMLEKLIPIKQVSQRWYKYAAINLCTITGQGDMPRFGTIEFRHMHGTSDPKILVPWINNILTLKKAALHYTVEEVMMLIRTMNTTSAYLGLYTKIFENLANPIEMQKLDFEYCITNLKLALFGNMKDNYIESSKGLSKYFRMVNKKTAQMAYKPPTKEGNLEEALINTQHWNTTHPLDTFYG